MTYDHALPDRGLAANPVHTALLSFPVACFSLTVLTDLAYVQTLNLLWLHFSEWLLLAGLVFGGIEVLVRLFDLIFRRVRPSWLAVSGGMVVLLLAVLNSFIHTTDGWTAVVPWGLTASILTVLAMLVTGWLGRRSARHA
jgi:uncharacterized membrane protein